MKYFFIWILMCCRWQVLNSKRFIQRVSFLCDACNGLFNLNAEGAQIEPDVVLMPIPQDSSDGDSVRSESESD